AYADLPWAYHLAWWTAVAFVGFSAYRFYVALEWYEVVPLTPLWVRFIAPSVILLATCWLYAAWLRGARVCLDDGQEQEDGDVVLADFAAVPQPRGSDNAGSSA